MTGPDEDPLVRALRAPGTARELAGEDAVLHAYREVHGVPPRARRALGRLGLGSGAIALSLALGGGVAAAYTQTLPDRVQDLAHGVLGPVGVPPSEARESRGTEPADTPTDPAAPAGPNGPTDPAEPTDPTGLDTPTAPASPGPAAPGAPDPAPTAPAPTAAAPTAPPSAMPPAPGEATVGPAPEGVPAPEPPPAEPSPDPAPDPEPAPSEPPAPGPGPDPDPAPAEGSTGGSSGSPEEGEVAESDAPRAAAVSAAVAATAVAPGEVVTVKGNVTDRSGAGLPGRTVRLALRSFGNRWTAYSSARSGDDGRVTLDGPPMTENLELRLRVSRRVVSEPVRVRLKPELAVTTNANTLRVVTRGAQDGDTVVLLRVAGQIRQELQRTVLDGAVATLSVEPASSRRTAYVVRLLRTPRHLASRTEVVMGGDREDRPTSGAGARG